ncbi:hypothetical protein HRG_014852 [Hirsutella rhossiliensis]
MTATGDQSVPREERVLLAVRAYQQGQFKSTRKAAAAYDVLNRQMVRSSRGDETEMGILDEDVYNFDETGFQMESLQRRESLPGLTGEVGQYSRSLEIENGLL